jgi:putative ABC transport system permease protein
MPVRNLVRTPRRTVLTAVAIGAAITTLVAIIGIVDSFTATLDRGDAWALNEAPDRLVVELAQFSPTSSPAVTEVQRSPAVQRAEPRLRLFGTVHPDGGGERFDLIVDLLDFDTAMWTPPLREGSVDAVRDGGIVLARKAARDAGVDVGDLVTVEHPRRVGVTYELVRSRVPVAAIHDGPLRASAYFDVASAPRFDMAGVTNVVDVLPAAGVSSDDAKRAIFEVPGVASVESVDATTKQFRDVLDEYFGVLRAVQFMVLLLALLIAFNSASIAIEERRRDHATMLAFGLPARVILATSSLETMITGLLGTVLGVAAGRAVVGWMMRVQLDDTMPEVAAQVSVSTATIVTAFVLGVLVVGLAPLLASRRVRRMDVPATLRVVE